MLDLDTQRVLKMAPAVIYTRLDREFDGQTWLGWAVETLVAQLPEHLDQAALDKVLAVFAVARDVQAVCQNALGLEKVTHAFNNQPCLMDALQPPHIEELMYAVGQIRRIAEHTQEKEESKKVVFHAQTPGYVASVGRYHQWTVLPRPLAFAQQMLDFLNGMHWRRANDQRIDTAVRALSDLSEQLGSLSDVSASSPSIKAMLDGFDTNRFEYRDAARLIGCYLYRPGGAAA